MVGRGRQTRNSNHIDADRGNDGGQRDPRDVKIERLQQRIRDLEIQQESPNEETESEPHGLDIPEFEGKAHPDDFIDWLSTIERIFDLRDIPDHLKMAQPVQNINHSAFRSMFEREKLSGNNFNDWFCQLKLVLRVEKKMFVIEQPLPTASAANSNAQVLLEWNTVYDAYNEVACLILGSMTAELHRQFKNSSPYDMITELKAMFEKQAGVERFDLIQNFSLLATKEEGKPRVMHMSSNDERIWDQWNVWLCATIGNYIGQQNRMMPANALQDGRSGEGIVFVYLSGVVEENESMLPAHASSSGKMTRKSFPHRPDRADGLIGIIITDVWGCEALVKRDTPDKLQQRSVKCIFIGYPKEMMGY
ncbi:hypothetical protein Tco_0748638 [Tanacetum coccineum]|uniref:Uncharacterized protein n=1 Tax=Tanacetum coccineum TaxID=301880 RepID=A0ABQ4YWZ9_9ASTR